MAREDPHVRLRFPPQLKEALEAAAKKSGRSMNAEVVARLAESIAAEEVDVIDIVEGQENEIALLWDANQEVLQRLINIETNIITMAGRLRMSPADLKLDLPRKAASQS